MTRIKLLEIFATVFIVGGVVALIYLWTASPLGTSDKVGLTMAISTVELVIVTGIYAWHTRKMAEEMREQRYAENLPLLVPHIPLQWNAQGMEPDEIPLEYLRSGIGISCIWRNAGKGVAINSQFSFWAVPLSSGGRANFFAPHESATIAVEEQWQVDYGRGLSRRLPAIPSPYSSPLDYNNMITGETRDILGAYHPRLEAAYQDIYERKIVTVQEFHVDEKSERAFLGELYFKINGRRLGEEVINHD